MKLLIDFLGDHAIETVGWVLFMGVFLAALTNTIGGSDKNLVGLVIGILNSSM